MTYLACRFPQLIAFGASGGPGYTTTIVANAAGYELRDQTDEDGLAQFVVSFNAKRQEQFDQLLAFYRVMRGRLHSFPFKDWSDYQVTVGNGVLGPLQGSGLTMYAAGTGFPQYQLYKSYTAAGVPDNVTVYRSIKKPIPERAPTVYLNSSPATEGSAAGNWEVDLSQGVVTWVSRSTKTITAITNANPGVVTATAHGLTNGQTVFIHNVGGMIELNDPSNFYNGAVYVVAGKTTDTFQLSGIDTSGFTTYTSGGTVELYPQPTELLTWAGEFDVPCRFDSDFMDADLVINKARGEFIQSWKSIALREVKVDP